MLLLSVLTDLFCYIYDVDDFNGIRDSEWQGGHFHSLEIIHFEQNSS